MNLTEVGEVVCMLYLFGVGFLGIMFTINVILKSPTIPTEKKIPIVFIVMALFIIFQPLLELCAGSYALALFQTDLQMKRKAGGP